MDWPLPRLCWLWAAGSRGPVCVGNGGQHHFCPAVAQLAGRTGAASPKPHHQFWGDADSTHFPHGDSLVCIAGYLAGLVPAPTNDLNFQFGDADLPDLPDDRFQSGRSGKSAFYFFS